MCWNALIWYITGAVEEIATPHANREEKNLESAGGTQGI